MIDKILVYKSKETARATDSITEREDEVCPEQILGKREHNLNTEDRQERRAQLLN
jgi:hypothetical protein